jgi:hypothetical protein
MQIDRDPADERVSNPPFIERENEVPDEHPSRIVQIGVA